MEEINIQNLQKDSFPDRNGYILQTKERSYPYFDTFTSLVDVNSFFPYDIQLCEQDGELFLFSNKELDLSNLSIELLRKVKIKKKSTYFDQENPDGTYEMKLRKKYTTFFPLHSATYAKKYPYIGKQTDFISGGRNFPRQAQDGLNEEEAVSDRYATEVSISLERDNPLCGGNNFIYRVIFTASVCMGWVSPTPENPTKDISFSDTLTLGYLLGDIPFWSFDKSENSAKVHISWGRNSKDLYVMSNQYTVDSDKATFQVAFRINNNIIVPFKITYQLVSDGNGSTYAYCQHNKYDFDPFDEYGNLKDIGGEFPNNTSLKIFANPV